MWGQEDQKYKIKTKKMILENGGRIQLNWILGQCKNELGNFSQTT